jgi:starch synthase
MAASRRLLFITGEVAPFTQVADTAALVRLLARGLQDEDYEARIMVPRYGCVRERANSLHEVIRLSGPEIDVGDAQETLSVKVASLPDVRMQVYFMDNDTYFGRDGVVADADGAPYDDNAERALFFTRAAMETVRSLRWGPDVVHAFGWAGGLTPMLLRSEGDGQELFDGARTVFTPDAVDAGDGLTEAFGERTELPLDGTAGGSLVDAGLAYADASIALPSPTRDDEGLPQFTDDPDEHARQAAALYDSVL